ncbi:MAG: hypothetical protein GY841_16410 [FCB group bacterium]|nr:hypothetical protein [FCB group bacterium]
MAVESALGTPGSYVDQRASDTNPSFPTETRKTKSVPHQNAEHWATREAQLIYEGLSEGVATVPKFIARPTTGTADPSIATLFEAMGCNVVTSAKTTLDGYTGLGGFSLAADAAAIGQAGLLELDSGAFHPCLVSGYSGAAAYDVVPAMGIPTQSSIGNDWDIMTTITPRVRQVPTDKTLAFRVVDRDVHTANETAWVHTGCAPASVADVTFAPNTAPELSFSISVGDTAGPDDITIANETYQDSSKFAIVDGPGAFKFSLATYADPVATASETEMISAIWTPGIVTVPIPSCGSTDTLNGNAGYMSKYEGSKIIAEMLVLKDFWTDFEGSNPAKYISLVQQTTNVSNTAFGLWMPQCRIVGSPTTDPYADENYMRVKVTFEPTTADYGSDTSTDYAGAAPWMLAISGEG